LHRRRNTPVKKYILFFLWIAATTVKIKAETITETTETPAAIKYIDNQILTTDLKDIAMSARKRIAVHGNI